MLFVSLLFSSVSDAKLSLTRSGPMWVSWGKCIKEKMRHTVGLQQYSALLWFIKVVPNGELPGGYVAVFSRLAFSTALSMDLR